GVASEFTVTRISADRIYLTSAAAAELHDYDLLRVRSTGFDVAIRNRTEALGILAVTGPRARAILTPLADADLSNAAFPWLSAAEMSVAGIAVRALRVSFAGELGWELHVPMNRLGALHDALTQAGLAHGVRPAGAYALNALRLEKGYRAWGADLTTERTPLEAGLDALVRAEGRTFIGREAMLGRADPWRMELLELACEGDLMPHAAHAVMQEGQPVGIVTSGAYGHRVSKMLALAYLRPGFVAPQEGGAPLTVDLLGTEVAAEILAEPPYDPRSQRQRSAAGARVDA
ncbi:MAG: aminomethyltransferase family protein, partial [Pseudomonadota bacterium]